MGNGFLHQSHATGRGGEVSARGKRVRGSAECGGGAVGRASGLRGHRVSRKSTYRGDWSRLLVMSVIASRVENRRSNVSLPVDTRRGFRRATAVRFGVVLFPVPAHRTGQADFPHPALGKDTRSSV